MNWRQRAAMGCMAGAILLMGCGHEKTEETIGMCADSFATMYFNWKLAEALPHCTGVSYQEGDTTATAHSVVRHFWEMAQSGMGGSMVDEATFALQMVKRAGQWLVRMEGLPQSEKTGRD